MAIDHRAASLSLSSHRQVPQEEQTTVSSPRQAVSTADGGQGSNLRSSVGVDSGLTGTLLWSRLQRPRREPILRVSSEKKCRSSR